MAIDVRRGVSYTYAIRFHLKGIKRQVFFDHMIQNLEAALDALQRKLDNPWVTFTEKDDLGRLYLGQKFFKYKESCLTLVETLQKHFTDSMRQIHDGLEDIEETVKLNKNIVEDVDYMFDGTYEYKNTWTCSKCLEIIEIDYDICDYCSTKRP